MKDLARNNNTSTRTSTKKMNSASVPNVKPKADPEEGARVHAMMEALRKENAQIIAGEEGVTKTLEERKPKVTDGVIDLKTVPTVYFKGVRKGEYTINHQIAKVFVEGCEDLTLHINGKILSSHVEAWRCSQLSINTQTPIKTMQLDLLEGGCKLGYKSSACFGCVVFQGVKGDIAVSFAEDTDAAQGASFSFAKCLEKYPDSSMEVDQFMVRFVEVLGPGLHCERCVRLKNGFLSTDREADEWDKRNTLAKERFMDKFLKEGGIHLNKSVEKKIKPNATCPLCDSGKKYKKCCMGKKEPATGVVPRNGVPGATAKATGAGGAAASTADDDDLSKRVAAQMALPESLVRAADVAVSHALEGKLKCCGCEEMFKEDDFTKAQLKKKGKRKCKKCTEA